VPSNQSWQQDPRLFVSLDRLQAAFQHSSTPVEQQAGSDARSPGHVGHRHPGLHRLLDQRIFSAVGQRRRRWIDVITSTRGGEAF
jgi:hypothetical protein